MEETLLSIEDQLQNDDNFEQIMYFSVEDSIKKQSENPSIIEPISILKSRRPRVSEDYRRVILSKEKRQMYIDMLRKFEHFDTDKVENEFEVEEILLEASKESIRKDTILHQEEESEEPQIRRKFSFDTSDIQTILYTDVINKTLHKRELLRSGKYNKKFKKMHEILELPSAIGIFLFGFLGLLQRPLWCVQGQFKNSCRESIDGSFTVPTSHIYFVDDWIFVLIELSFMTFFMIARTMKILAYPEDKDIRARVKTLSLIYVIILLYEVINMITDVPVQLNIYLRPIFILVYSRLVRNALYHYIKIFWISKSVILLQLFNILFFACLGKVLFHGTKMEEDIFSGFFNSVLNLFLLQMNTNFPKMMQPIYGDIRSAAIYFVVFLLINNIMLVRLTLSIIYVNYKDQLIARVEKLLSKNEVYDQRADFLQMAHEYFPIPSNVKALLKKAEKVRRILLDNPEVDSNGQNMDDSIPESLRSIIYKLSSSPLRMRIGKVILNKNFDLLVGCLSGVYFIFLIFSLSEKDALDEVMAWVGVTFTISLFLIVEAALKLFVLGPWLFFTSIFNIYDGVVSIASVATYTAFFADQTLVSQMVIRWFCLLKIARFFIILLRIESLKMAFKAMFMFLPLFMDLFSILFILISFFAGIGVHCFGGLLTSESDVSTWGDGYRYYNFNDIGQAVFLLFGLLSTYWSTTVDVYCGIMRSDGPKVYFLAYYLITTFFVEQIVIAFMIEFIVTQWRRRKNASSEGVHIESPSSGFHILKALRNPL